jgi:hypothetical protein
VVFPFWVLTSLMVEKEVRGLERHGNTVSGTCGTERNRGSVGSVRE